MKTLKGIAEVHSPLTSSIVTIGNFDGIHLGHREILKQVVLKARQGGKTSVVYTFRPHPQQALNPENEFHLINTYEEKYEFLESLGIDIVIEEPFNKDFSGISPLQFFKHHLMEKLSACTLYVGYDFGFGKGRTGNLDVLSTFCEQNKVELIVTKPLKIDNAVCSSSSIRELLRNGDVIHANQLLDREFFYRGEVIKGFSRGHNLGFATANLQIPLKIQIKPGVYVTRVRRNGILHNSVTNVGYRPTFADPKTSAISVETHIFDFNENIYGETIDVLFVERLRDEKKFENVDALVEQIRLDSLKARQIHGA